MEQTGNNQDLYADNMERLASAVYLQVSTISQALIFVTRSRGWSFMERPGLLLMGAFVIAQLVSTCRGLVCFEECRSPSTYIIYIYKQLYMYV
jgi:hypothetical protein